MPLPLPPQRRITASTPPARQAGRHGVRAVSTLECGHVVETIADTRRRGWCFCFQCLKENTDVKAGV
jgi:hypothetical protein